MPQSPPPAFAIWITGLPGSGKSTLAEDVAARIRARGLPVEVIDSGKLRKTPLGASLGFSKDDRDRNVRQHGLAAQLLAKNGVVAVVAAVSPYRATRDQIRAHLDEFVEVWVSTPKAACIDRDKSGVWTAALQGEIRNFTGVDDPYEPPLSAEVVVDLSVLSPQAAADAVETVLLQDGLLPEHTVEAGPGEDSAFLDATTGPMDS